MKTMILSILILAALGTSAFAQTPVQGAREPAKVSQSISPDDHSKPDPIPAEGWGSALASSAKKFNIHFTIEKSDDSLSFPSKISPPEAVESIDELIAYLQKVAPQSDIFRDSSDKQIIHIVDKTLHASAPYSLNGRANFAFSGDVGEFVALVNRISDGKVIEKNNGTLYEPVLDHSLPVKLGLPDAEIRTALSLGIPSNRSGVILWTAHSSGEKVYFSYSVTPKVSATTKPQ